MTAKRYDDGKSPVVEGCFRYFPRALLAVGDVSAFGSNKYKVPLSDKNWLGLEQDRIVNSEGRHLLKEEIEGLYDSESLLLHKAHKAWNALADLEKELMKGTELKDRAVIPPMAAADVRGNAVDTGLTLSFSEDTDCKLLPKSEMKEGLPVKVYDRYRFAIPLKGVIQQLSSHNDGVRVKLLESNSKKYPVGCEVWVDKHQLFGSN